MARLLQGQRRGGPGSRARIRTSVERTKTACPAWLDDPGLLRRKLYRNANQARPRSAGPGERGFAGGQAAGLPCMRAECAMEAMADTEGGELLMT